ncbi:MAG: hypothetical protein RCG15_02170 [Candidatus Rickettsia vulgarisii]
MAKDGSLYIGTHTGQYDSETLTLTHASFLRPAEMAGMISINDKGKIELITDNSGHYAPEDLGMYRGIKELQKSMPNVFTENAEIEIRGQATSIDSFMKDMEQLNSNGIPKHQELKNERIEKNKQSSGKLTANATKINDDTKLELLSEYTIANLDLDKKHALLDLAAKKGDARVIEEIFKQPERRELVTKKILMGRQL